MSPGPRRWPRGWLVVGGLAWLAASPVSSGLRRIVLARLGRLPVAFDPVGPFREAPCERRGSMGRSEQGDRSEAIT